MTQPDPLELERVAYGAWPAQEVAELYGWRLRASDGFTRRGNSVWTARPCRIPLEKAIPAVEEFYRSRQLRPCFQVFDWDESRQTEQTLASLGYRSESGVSVCWGNLGHALSLRAGPDLAVEVDGEFGEEWAEVAIERSRFQEQRIDFRALLRRLGSSVGYATATHRGVPVGGALAVVDPPWVGVFALMTLPDHRGRGVASAVLRALAQWAKARGASYVYHQTEHSNRPALELARQFGMLPCYSYHYRALVE